MEALFFALSIVLAFFVGRITQRKVDLEEWAKAEQRRPIQLRVEFTNAVCEVLSAPEDSDEGDEIFDAEIIESNEE